MLRWVYYFLYVVMTIACVAPASAQRVYASLQSSPSNTLTYRIDDRTLAADSDLGTYSRISVLTSIGGIINVYQNVQFDAIKPAANSPVFIKLAAKDVLGVLTGLDLLGKVSVQKTLATVLQGVGQLVSSLFTSYSPNDAVILQLQAGSDNYDGVRISLNANLLMNVDLYGAFFITPPSMSNLNACAGESFTISVSNFFSGYTYKVFDQATGGVLKATSTTSSLSFTAPTTSGNTTYYVEAIDSGVYSSARIPVVVNVISKITPLVQLAN